MDFGNALGIEFRATKEILYKGEPARSVSGSRHYLTETDDLWDALTNAQRIPRWFLPISGNLRTGGRYQLEGHAGGTITQCAPPKALDVTWEYADNINWIMLRLEPEGQGSKLTLEQVMLKDDASEAHWKQYGPGATGVGWELSFLALGYHLANDGMPINPEEFATWMTSNDGKIFVRKSAKAWGEAHIASGESADIANNMAELTANFYTGD